MPVNPMKVSDILIHQMHKHIDEIGVKPAYFVVTKEELDKLATEFEMTKTDKVTGETLFCNIPVYVEG